MIGPFSWIDLLFLITIVLLVFNGLRNGAVFSIVNLLSIPIAIAVVIAFGKPFTVFLASNGLGVSPLIAYIILFFGTVLVLHIVGTVLRGVIKAIPLLGLGDALIGGLVGFIEAWLLWVIVLLVLHNFLQDVQQVPGVDATQFRNWQQVYNDAISNSLFARVNSFIITKLPIH